MFKSLKAVAFSALIGLGALAAMPATASAEGVYFNLGNRSGVGVEFVDHRDGYRHHRPRHGRGWDRPRGCSAERAVNKAERMGLRRARIVGMNRNSIRVAGRKWGERMTIVYARAPGCPIIGGR